MNCFNLGLGQRIHIHTHMLIYNAIWNIRILMNLDALQTPNINSWPGPGPEGNDRGRTNAVFRKIRYVHLYSILMQCTSMCRSICIQWSLVFTEAHQQTYLRDFYDSPRVSSIHFSYLTHVKEWRKVMRHTLESEKNVRGKNDSFATDIYIYIYRNVCVWIVILWIAIRCCWSQLFATHLIDPFINMYTIFLLLLLLLCWRSHCERTEMRFKCCQPQYIVFFNGLFVWSQPVTVVY